MHTHMHIYAYIYIHVQNKHMWSLMHTYSFHIYFSVKKTEKRVDARAQHSADTEEVVKELFREFQDVVSSKDDDISIIFLM